MQHSIPTSRKVLYGAGDIMGTLAFTVTALFLPYFFTDVLGLPSLLAGVTIFIGHFWDALTDPFAGHISDRTKSRFGRRRPYFIYMALPIGIAFVMLFTIPAGMAAATTFILCTIAYIIFMTSTTFYLVPYLAYGMEIERNYDGRTSLTAWRMLFSIAFGLVGAVVPKMIWESTAMPSRGFLLMAVILAVPLTFSTVLPFFAGKEPPLKQMPETKFFDNFKAAFKSKDFVKGAAIFVATWVGVNVLQTLLIYYFKYVINMSDQFELVIGVLFGVTILALPLWVFLSSKLDKRKAYVIGAALFGATLLILLSTEITLKYLWVIVPLLGVGLSALHVMPTAILPEAIEGTTNGSSGEGAHYGIVTFMYKMGNALAQFGVLGMLGIAGYIETSEEAIVQQPETAITAIRLMLTILPAALLVIGIIVALRFKIGREHSVSNTQKTEQ